MSGLYIFEVQPEILFFLSGCNIQDPKTHNQRIPYYFQILSNLKM